MDSTTAMAETTLPDFISNLQSTTARLSMTSASPVHYDVSSTSEAQGMRMTSVSVMMMMVTTTANGWSFANTSTSWSSMEDVEQFLQHKNDEFTMLVLPAMIFLAILFAVGVSGNCMVLYVYNRKLQKGTIRWFVQALAIFDLLSCLVAIPGEIIDMRNNYTFGSSPMCKVLRSVSMFCTVASGMTLMVVAVERYKRICTPLRKQITPKGAQVIITVSTVAASICAAPACIIYGPQTIPTDNPTINGTDCSTADVFMGTVIPLAFSSFQFLLFVLGALGLIVLYSLIGRKVWSHAHFRKMGFRAGINRRMSFFFNGSECSSPTTDDTVFAFPVKRNIPAVVVVAEEDNSNTSHGNVDPNDNNNVVHTKAEKVATVEGFPSEVEKMEKTPAYSEPCGDDIADRASMDTEKHYPEDEHSEPDTLTPHDLSLVNDLDGREQENVTSLHQTDLPSGVAGQAREKLSLHNIGLANRLRPKETEMLPPPHLGLSNEIDRQSPESLSLDHKGLANGLDQQQTSEPHQAALPNGVEKKVPEVLTPHPTGLPNGLVRKVPETLTPHHPSGTVRPVSMEQPPTPTGNFPHTLDTFRRTKSTSRPISRDRVKSGDSAVVRGRYRRRSTHHTQSDMRRFLHRSESVNSGTRRTTLMLFLITLVYLLSFLPYLILMIVKVLDEESLSGRGGGWELAHNILLRSYFINSMANPIIYSFCSRTFRKECSKVLHCRCCRSPLFVY